MPLAVAIHRLYQLGMVALNGSLANRGREYFDKAVALDPNYANAWAGIARTNTWGFASETTKGEYEKSLEAINKALFIDPNLSEAHISLCDIKLFYEYDIDGAEKACKRAVDLDPNSSTARLQNTFFLTTRGRFDEALADIKTALDLDPAAFRIQRQYANVLADARRYSEAEEQYKLLLDMYPNERGVYPRLIRTLEVQGKESEAYDYLIRLLPLEKTDNEAIEHVKAAYAASGWRGAVVERIKISEASEKPHHFRIAELYAYLGDKDKAFEFLEKAFERRAGLMVFLRYESHHFDSLRDDPRFEDLISRVEGK